jgi:hypothetical protein
MLPLIGLPRDRLASDAGPVLAFTALPFAAVLLAVVVDEDVERGSLFRYDVEETDRGNDGRREETGESGFWSM